MAAATDHQGFPLAGYHPTLPGRRIGLSLGRQIGQLADVMNFNVLM
jgi:hypothetical protein